MPDNRHGCAAEGCEAQVAYAMLMCHAHWRRVPADLQKRVYRNWRRGRPTTDYPAAVRAAVAAVAEGDS